MTDCIFCKIGRREIQAMVVYETLYDNPVSKLWVRPAEMFEEIIEIDGVKVPRFVFQSEQ